MMVIGMIHTVTSLNDAPRHYIYAITYRLEWTSDGLRL